MVQRTYVMLDEQGALRVGGTRITIDSIVAAFEQGHSAETISQQYPALSLEQVYGAIAYYLANKDEVDAYLQKQEERWRDGREKADANASPVVQRLRQIAKSKRDDT